MPLVTIVGEPGVGKSRLAAELIGRIGPSAGVLRGRCLSYGEGITYWAVGEIVRDAVGIRDEHSVDEARARIDVLLADTANGYVVATRPASTRRRRHPLGRTHLSRPAGGLAGGRGGHTDPPAVPRPTGSPGDPARLAPVRLDPLADNEVELLLGNLLGGTPAGVSDRRSQTSAGNPLFVEELVEMLVDEGALLRGNGSWELRAS